MQTTFTWTRQTPGPDYPVQGEYVGEQSGAQVIALGDGKFHIVGWSHGLPGTVDDAEKKVEANAHREGDQVVFDENGWKGFIKDGTLHGTNDEGHSYDLKRTIRMSPTQGAKPPAGAIVLFRDGTSTEAWNGGHMDERHFLAGGTKSKQKFQDYTLHVEFLLPFKPAARGQARANSGVYMQDRYEIQVLDSFGLKGENNECGAIYGQTAPRINMCYPPLQWQTYDVDFTAAKFDASGKKTKNAVITVKHNGVTVMQDKEITGPTGGGQPETPEPGPIQLQAHDNPVYFQNIWIVEHK